VFQLGAEHPFGQQLVAVSLGRRARLAGLGRDDAVELAGGRDADAGGEPLGAALGTGYGDHDAPPFLAATFCRFLCSRAVTAVWAAVDAALPRRPPQHSIFSLPRNAEAWDFGIPAFRNALHDQRSLGDPVDAAGSAPAVRRPRL